MANNQISIPHILPLTFRPIVPQNIEKYISRNMDKFLYYETIKTWETKAIFAQPFQYTDPIILQLKTEFGPLNLNLYNCYGAKIASFPFVQKQRDRFNPDIFIYTITKSLNPYPEGIYYFTLSIGSSQDELYITEPIDLKTKHENSLLVTYGNSSYKGGVIFETGIKFQLRFFGSLGFKPGSESIVYADQTRNMTILDDIPYRVWTLSAGGKIGIPDNFADKLNRILGCDYLNIEEVLYSKDEGSKLEQTKFTKYPLKYYEIELFEALNRDSLEFVDDVVTTTRLTVTLNVESKGFGPDDTGDTIQQIKDIE